MVDNVLYLIISGNYFGNSVIISELFFQKLQKTAEGKNRDAIISQSPSSVPKMVSLRKKEHIANVANRINCYAQELTNLTL